MYVSKLEISNIKCFGNIAIDFCSAGSICKWGLILGDNGVGKTTVLRSIAVSLCGKESVSGLLDELYGDWVREGSHSGSIRLEMRSSAKSESIYWIQTEFAQEATGLKVLQETHPSPFPWHELFLCGYGAGRPARGSEVRREYKANDSIYTLFKDVESLQDPELVIRRVMDLNPRRASVVSKKLLHWMDTILMLPPGSHELTKRGLAVTGPWGRSMPAMALGDGHIGTTTLVLDMLGWSLLQGQSMFKEEVSGVVLIDEIEQHLHPSWQKAIIRLLSRQFPRVQFIATTHSALCTIGTTKLSNAECTIALLLQDKEGIAVKDKLLPPRGRRADQILTSYLFGLPTSGDDAIVDKVERYSQLAGKERRSSEETEFQALREELDEELGTEETELQHQVAEAIQDTLERRLEEAVRDPTAIGYEIKRQLRQLFNDNK